ncbi:MAG TPA: DinB family protein [Anaerolineales bacterium]|nr:DinB family protein [Anaerolineales bacterium]
MNPDDITTLIRFNFWADDRLIRACERLPWDEFARPITPDPGWGSLLGVLVHILDTEFGWRGVLQARDDDKILAESDFSDMAALRARWDVEKAAWLDFVDGLTGADLEKAYRGELDDGPNVWQVIVHVITHGIQHRSEAAMVLTGYGHSPGELDFAVFMQENLA